MLGFLFGTACLIGLVSAVKRRRWARWGYGYGGLGPMGHPCGGHGPGFGGPGFGAPGFGGLGFGAPEPTPFGSPFAGGPFGGGPFGGGPFGGGPFGGGPFGGGPFGGGPFRGRWGGRWSEAVAARLGLREDQARTVRDALRDLADAGRELGRTTEKGREQLAAAFRGESLDELSLGEAHATFDEAFDKARKAFVDALAKVHAVLDAEQRKVLAQLLEGGFGALRGRPWGGPPGAGPYRGGWL